MLSRETIISSIVTLIGGGLIGWGTTSYFAGEEQQRVVELAKAEGRILGIEIGTAEAMMSFELSAGERFEKRFGEMAQSIREDARSAGYLEGFDLGSRQGYDEGFRACIVEQLETDRALSQATRNWSNYSKILLELFERASSIDEISDLNEGVLSVLAQARAVVEVANALRAAHIGKSNAFNSLINELAIALEDEDINKIQEISRALIATSEIKGELFINQSEVIQDLFRGIERN